MKKMKKTKDKEIKMVEIEMDLPNDVIEGLIQFATEAIKNDRQALLNYGVNKALEEVIKSNGKCLKKK